MCGESESVDAITIAVGCYEAIEIIKNFDLNHVYNCDETALFCRMLPCKTSLAGSARGKKNIEILRHFCFVAMLEEVTRKKC